MVVAELRQCVLCLVYCSNVYCVWCTAAACIVYCLLQQYILCMVYCSNVYCVQCTAAMCIVHGLLQQCVLCTVYFFCSNVRCMQAMCIVYCVLCTAAMHGVCKHCVLCNVYCSNARRMQAGCASSPCSTAPRAGSGWRLVVGSGWWLLASLRLGRWVSGRGLLASSESR